MVAPIARSATTREKPMDERRARELLQAERARLEQLVHETNDAALASEADRTLHLFDGRVTPDGARRSG